ncbi:hypothetical protein BDU57DRAFT_46632 [Ampelomyces quisqualis]|uniref:DUF7029 domain-containing protein n=1 Tax=Ampelomyces quisqualis TaxID=50730 RepID=A0A6A5QZX0_AMPQU|nr:hypothetical protein BDU57DRAFT_46632 [Ampelomyces quisqualis]
MRFVDAAVALAGIATALSPPAYSHDGDRSGNDVTPTIEVSSGPTSYEATRSTPKVCRAKSAPVYETVYGGKADSTATKAAGGSKASPSAKVGKPFGYNEEQFHHKTEGHMKLKSCNHWSHNAKDPNHIVPTNVGEKTQIYYAENGEPHPSKTFYFGILDLQFKAPAVVLEQSAYISNAAYSSNELVIDFTSAVACDFAKTSWTKGTIIVSSSAECKEASDDDQCYFEIEDLIKSDDGKSITVKGKPQSQSDCTEGGEANWGMYRPSVSNGGNIVTQPGENGTSTGPPGYNGATGPNGSSGGGNGTDGSNTNSTDSGTSGFGDELSTCRAPIDTKYNLPTACVGEYFDLDLDEALGYGALSSDDLAFLNEAMAGLDDDTLAKVTRRTVLHRRNIERRFLGSFFRFVANKIIAPAVAVLKTAVNVAVTLTTGVVQLVTTGTISGSIRESFSFALPNGGTADAKQVESPWGPSILIAAYGTEAQGAPTNGLQKDGYLNIFCVGCGAQGRVELAGRATWSVTQGITQGELEAWADLKAALKIGVDAQIQLSREWNKNLFQVGLPGLSFGVITIGPQVRLDSRVTLEAQAKGRLLAGAELSWNRAYAKIDMVTPANSIRQNFDPVFHPTFEAEGSISVGAELGLPIGFEFGISVASWKKTVALINEPMIKGIAKAAASAELSNGQFTAGFTAIEGCIGIYSNLSWRNRLYGDVLGIRQFDIMDTGYKSIKSACIPIGPQNQTPAIGNGQTSSAIGNGQTSSQSSIQPAASQAPTNNDDEPSSVTPNVPQTSSNGNETPETQLPPAVSSEGAATPQASAQPEGSNDIQPSAPVTPSAGDEPVANKRSIYSRQSNSTGLMTNNNSTAPGGLRDLTDSIKEATNAVTYSIPDIPTVAYAREDGYEFTKILAEKGEYNIFYCSNGNMYVKKTAQAAGLGCDELFVYSNNAVAGDGAGRYLYYHTNTMEAAGVSRLRLGDEENPVKGTSALALVAWNSTEVGTERDADIEGLYFAADYDTKAFYWLTFCSYKDGQPPKVFVVEDLEKGIAVLESGDVKFSVTGGDVDKCFALSAKEDSASPNTWSQFDDSETTTPDGLEYTL